MTPEEKNSRQLHRDEAFYEQGEKNEHLQSLKNKPGHRSRFTLRECVTNAMDDYFSHLDGEITTDIYQMVMSQVESALLSSVMEYVKGNQSKAALCLGISRGTLLKKLTEYKLHPCKKRG